MKLGRIRGTIIFFITGLAIGGAETQAVNLAIRLRQRGWKIVIVSLISPKAYVKELQEEDIPVISLNVKSKLVNPYSILKVIRIIHKLRPQIIHSHMFHANIFARLLRILAPVPILICTAHNTYEHSRKTKILREITLREWAYRITDFLCDLTTQVSKQGLKRYVRVRAVPCHKIRYISNGVDTKLFYPDLEARFKIRTQLGLGKKFVWVSIGRFVAAKDYPTLLQAFARLRDPESILLICGEGPLKDSMESLTESLGIKSQVWFLGLRRDIPKLMSASDAYVMSSIYEGLPMVLLEAQACGLPVVATAVGGNVEVVQNGKNGYLVPPRNPEALAEAMLSIMNLSEEERRRMGEFGRQYIETNYNLERIVDQWEELYLELIEQKKLKHKV